MRDFITVTKALADENRVRMLLALRQKELCLCQIIELVGLAPSTVSKHMSILKQSRLVDSRKDGRWMYYRLPGADAPEAVKQAVKWVFQSLENDPKVLTDSAPIGSNSEDRPARVLQKPVLPREKRRETYCSQTHSALAVFVARKMAESRKLNVLFLCTGNSCRSQMAEGWARHLKADTLEAYSAGIETRGLDPFAVKTMAEVGIDISAHRSKHARELRDISFDYVVTVCGHANEHCPVFPAKTKVVHVGFDDPPRLAINASTEEERLAPYRRVRDEIRNFVEGLPNSLMKPSRR